MKRSNSAANNRPGPIVVEPDEDKLEIDLFGESFFSPFRIFSPFRDFELIEDFSNFDKNFENLEKRLSNQKGHSIIQSMSSHVEYKDGKIVKDDKKGFYLENDNGKGYIRVIKKTPEGKFEEKRDFDCCKNKIKFL